MMLMQDVPLACNVKAMPPEKRPRYNELVNQLRRGIRSRVALPHGYRYTFTTEAVSLREAAEWIELERLCCPFLTLQLAATGASAEWTLTLTGPKGVKAILDEEFPFPAKK
jgi:hypothetical protein